MRQTVQFIKENYGGFSFNCKQYDRLYELMKHDKKNTAGTINFTLLKEVGNDFRDVRFLSGVYGRIIPNAGNRLSTQALLLINNIACRFLTEYSFHL